MKSAVVEQKRLLGKGAHAWNSVVCFLEEDE